MKILRPPKRISYPSAAQTALERDGHGRQLARAQSAFTLVEVLVSVFVLGVATVSLYAAFGTGFMLVDSARLDLRATQILTQKAEALRLCSWSSLTNYPISFTERYDPASSGTGGAFVVRNVS